MNTYKRLFALLLFSFLLLPRNANAQVIQDLECKSSQWSGTCYDNSSSHLTGSTDNVHPDTEGNRLIYPLSSTETMYLYQVGTRKTQSKYLAYNLYAGTKFEFIYKIYTKSFDNESQFVDKNIDYSYLSFSGVDLEGKLLEHDFLGTGNPFEYINVGIKKEVLTNGNVYSLVIDLIPKVDLIGFHFNFEPKIENPTDTSISVQKYNSVAGATYTEYYEPIITVAPYEESKIPFIDFAYDFFATEVDEFTTLTTTIEKPIIPLPEGPVYTPYDPNKTEITKPNACESDNVLDRFTCFFQNIQNFFDDIFGRIGEGFQSLIDNLLTFFNQLLNPEVDESTSNGGGFFDNFTTTDNGGISSIVTSPLRLIKGLLNSGSSCQDLSFTIYGKKVAFPSGCILWDKVPDNVLTIYHTLICGVFAYYLLIKLFKDIENLKDPNKSEVSTLDL